MKNIPCFFLYFFSFLICAGCAQPFHNVISTSESSGAGIDTADDFIPDPLSRTKMSTEVFADNDASTIEEEPNSTVNAQTVIDEAIDYCEVSQELWQKGELENALEALDLAYSLLLKLDHDNSPKLIQQKEDLRFMISKRILEIYASRHIVVSGNHKAIPLEMNHHIQAEINSFMGNEKAFFIEAYERSGLYRPYIVKALEEAGLPVELSWLPLIESGFKVQAMSKARALGLWQFISSTGYKFGLERDKYIDERMDPIKATKAATDYLKELHQIFGDWSTALAAYNCGEGRVLRLIRSQNINYLDNFWDLYERLPAETSRYVPRYLATLHIINNPEKYGLDKIEVMKPVEYETVPVSRKMHLRDIAQKIGVTERTLTLLNPELRYSILPDENYMLKVPPNRSETLLAKIDKIPIFYQSQEAYQEVYVKHKVRSGESLSSIAKRYRTTVNSIIKTNKIKRRNIIAAGTVLKIRRSGKITHQTSSYQKDNAPNFITYRVKNGDSLWILAKRYGTTAKSIIAMNNLSNTYLYIGQKLKVPGSLSLNEPQEEINDFKTYLVVRGDSPFKIAQKHNMPLDRFLSINKLSPRHSIFPGQNLFVE